MTDYETLRNQGMEKRANGQYYTRGNPFSLKPFKTWAARVGLPKRRILEPFAGANHIIKSLKSIKLCNDFVSYDINPGDQEVIERDTIRNFPEGYQVCVTNPPWLAKNSATRRGLHFPSEKFDDLYKHCISLCLKNCDYVAALVPASYLHSKLFRGRLCSYILLHNDSIFNDTDNPVCLALFDKVEGNSTSIYYDDGFLGNLEDLEKRIPTPKTSREVIFNHPSGNLGFVSFDSTRERTIRFCDVEDIEHYPVKISSRFFTRIKCDVENVTDFVNNLNSRIQRFRDETNDLFLTPFKGIRSDNKSSYRRRMSFGMARVFINAA